MHKQAAMEQKKRHSQMKTQTIPENYKSGDKTIFIRKKYEVNISKKVTFIFKVTIF